MSWARIDDGFHDHPKVDELSLAAVGLWTLSLTWAHRHRKTALLAGHITEARVRKIAGKHSDALVAELVTARLWDVEAHVGGWVIHDFADYLPRARDPEEAAESGRKGARAKWQKQGKAIADSQASSQADSQQVAGKEPGSQPATDMASDGSRASAPAFPSRPDPSQEVVTSGGDRPETLRAVDATDPPNDEHCSRHPDGNPRNEPCRGCQRVEERKARRIERDTEQRRRDDEARARACTRCDGVWVLDDEQRPTRHKCDHRRSA